MMTIVDLKRRITTNEILPMHIFYGEEYEVMNRYVDMIVDKRGSLRRYKTVQSLCDSIQLVSPFETIPDVAVVYDDSDFLNDSVIWDTICDDLKSVNIVLIIKYESLDMRSKFVKKFSDNITLFDRLSDSILSKYISDEFGLSKDMCSYLIDACSGSYGRILLEMNKTKHLSDELGISIDNSFRELYNSGNIFFDQCGEVFDVVDCLMMRDKNSYGYVSSESKFRGDNPFLILSVLGSTVRSVLQMQTSTKDVEKCTGLSKRQIGMFSKYRNKFKSSELMRFLKVLYFCDKSVKSGFMPSDMVLDYVAVSVL